MTTIITKKKSRSKKMPDSTRKKTGKDKLTEGMKKAMWEPGKSGNPKGRPKGSRNKFAEAFIDDLLKDWEEKGASALKRCRIEDPAAYLRVCASILPKEFNINADDSALEKLLEKFDDQELDAFIRTIAASGLAEQSQKNKTEKTTGSKPNTVH